MAGRGREQTLPSWMVQMQADSKGGASFPLTGVPPLPIGPQNGKPPPAYGMATGYPSDILPNMPPVLPQLGAAFISPNNSLSVHSTSIPSTTHSTVATTSNISAPIDPVNDVKCWSEHFSEDKRPFWFNSVLKTSTYDKPQCLKTAIERSIPVCVWKEFTSTDGKKYYSDGTSSTWTMPPEFKEWKEKVDAAEKRQLELADKGKDTVAKGGRESASVEQPVRQQAAPRLAKPASVAAVKDDRPEVVYASQAEAVAAFKALLFECGVSHSSRFKDVQEACSGDVRWGALKTSGEKKQALAEYQTQRVKLEKEELKARVRRNRDAFFVLLAETTAISHTSRYKDFADQLAADHRGKAVEDTRLREDYFLEFVEELAKKEREDLAGLKEERLLKFNELLVTLEKTDKLTYRSSWSTCKSELEELSLFLAEDDRFRVVEESSLRRRFQNAVDALETRHRESKAARRDALKRQVAAAQSEFKKQCLEPLAQGGRMSAGVKWPEVLAEHVQSWREMDGSALTSLLELAAKVDESGKAEEEEVLLQSSVFRDCWDEIAADLKERFREDRRLFRGALDRLKVKLQADTKLEHLEERLKELAQSEVAGELTDLLTLRRANMQVIFAELLEPVIKESKIAEEKKRKREDRYQTLLEEYFYRSDHIDVTWDEAKKQLHRHSAYDDLDRSDRRRLFDAHLDSLRAKLAARKTTMKVLRVEEGEEVEEREESTVRAAPRESAIHARESASTGPVGRGKGLTLPSWMTSEVRVGGLSPLSEGPKRMREKNDDADSNKRSSTSEERFADKVA